MSFVPMFIMQMTSKKRQLKLLKTFSLLSFSSGYTQSSSCCSQEVHFILLAFNTCSIICIVFPGNIKDWVCHLNITQKFPLASMGVLAPGSAHARPSARPPIDTRKKFRHTCLHSHLQTSPPTPQKSYQKFRNPRTTFENTPLCPPNYSIVRGVGGVPQ